MTTPEQPRAVTPQPMKDSGVKNNVDSGSALAATARTGESGHTAFQNDSQDSLQGCLEFFVRRYRLTHTLTSLTTGLPLQKNRLTPSLFSRAAARAGLVCRVVKRDIRDLNAHVLPAVFMQKNGKAVVLVSRKGDGETPENDTFTLLDTFTGEKSEVVGVKNLNELYGGYLILVRQSLASELSADSRNPAQRWFWQALRQFRPMYGKVVLAAVFINLIGVVTSLFAMNVYDRVVPNSAFETLWVLALGALTAYMFEFAFKQLRSYFVDVAGKGADIILASRIYAQLLNVRLGQQQMSAGAFANQLRDYDSLRDFFSSGTVMTLVDIPFIFFFIFIIFLLGGPLALIPLVAIPIVLAVCFAVQTPMRGLVAQAAHDMDLKHGHLVETINALENIKAIGSHSHAQGRWERLSGIAARIGTKTRFLSNIAINFSAFMQNVVYAAMVVAGVYMIDAKMMTMGALVASTMLVGRAMGPLSQVVGLLVRYEQSKNSLESLSKFMLTGVERPLGKQFVHVARLSGSVQFQNVNFVYPGSKINSLNNINFSIRPGERVGIVGRAGSGKSSIARVLMGLYEPEGSVLLDGLEQRQLDPAEVRKNLCYFPQNLHLFRGTLRENLLMANPEASDEQLLQAVEISGAYRLLRRHPMGFDLPVGERGELLSGGQRQAVGLARALMHDGSIAVLDDPTSEMDAGSESWVIERLNKWLKNRTLILITHRPAMLALVDRLLVIDDGKLLADGPKDKVLAWLAGSGKQEA